MPSSAPSKRSKYQKGEVLRIHRSQIKLAPYNPRASSKEAARRLRENISEVGLLGPALVWNARTGNLISGHLRLAQLDVLEEGAEYALDMTVVDWPEKRERAQNVFFNNPWTQGEFDLEALGAMLAQDLDELDAFGMDVVEVQHLFPDDPRFGSLFADAEPDNATQPAAKAALDEIEADKDADRDARQAERQDKKRTPEETTQHRNEYGKIMDEANSADFYVVVVCRDAEQCTKVLEAVGTQNTDSRYVSAEVVLRALGQ